MRNSAVILGSILILASLPSVLAQVSTPLAIGQGWASKGSFEPSTHYDSSDLMYQSPNTDPAREQVYFNGFEDVSNAVVRTTATPNLASIGLMHRSSPHSNMAMLGTWVDCNGDGYIGLADHGLFEYRVELLTGQTNHCPVKPFPATNGAAPTHNDGAWVHEFIPIGFRSATTLPLDRNYYDDAGARVWADGGVPGAPGGYVCFLAPVPTGTYHTVGSIGTYADCLGRGKLKGVFDASQPVNDTYHNTLAPIHNPWGEESDGSYVNAFDCNSPQVVPTRALPAGGMGVGVSQPQVPQVHAPSGPLYQTGDPSPAGTVNETVTDVDDCNRADNGVPGGDTDGAIAHEPYSNEGNDVTNQDTQPPVKIRNDPLYYQEAQRLSAGPSGNFQTQDGGTGITSTQGVWTPFTSGTGDNAFVDVFGPQVSRVVYTTWYAMVPNATGSLGLKLPANGATAVYGADACHGATTGHVGGWECDATQWDWGANPHGLTIHGVDASQAYLDSIRVGSPYNLRDVDCYDESISAARDLGVSWGLLTGSECS